MPPTPRPSPRPAPRRPAGHGRRHGEKWARIRRAKLAKIPYVLVVGDHDVAAGTVGVNRRGWTDQARAGRRVADLVPKWPPRSTRKGLPEDRAPSPASV